MMGKGRYDSCIVVFIRAVSFGCTSNSTDRRITFISSVSVSSTKDPRS